jgi:hypothetical protein
MFICCFRAPVSEVEYTPPRNTPTYPSIELKKNSLHVNMKAVQEPKIKFDEWISEPSEGEKVIPEINLMDKKV